MAKIKCPKCGNELEEGSRFCTSCGSRLGQTPAPPTKRQSDEKPERRTEPQRTARRQLPPSLTLNSDKNETVTMSAKSESEPKPSITDPVETTIQEDKNAAGDILTSTTVSDYSSANEDTSVRSDKNIFINAPVSGVDQTQQQKQEPITETIQPQSDFHTHTQTPPSQYPYQPDNTNDDVAGGAYPLRQQNQPSPMQQRAYMGSEVNFAATDTVNVKTADKKQAKRQTIPEKLLNIIASIILCVLILTSSLSALGVEFINQTLTSDGIEKIIENIDINQIILNGKPLPEAVINSFGLKYDTLSDLGISEERINTAFKSVVGLISKSAIKVIDAARNGVDIESIILVSKEEILEALRNNTTVLQDVPNLDINDKLFNDISEGLDSAGFGNGLSVRQIIDSLPESQANSARSSLQTITIVIASIKYVRITFAVISGMLLIVLFIVNKRRFRMSLMWSAIDSAVISVGMFFVYFGLNKVFTLDNLTDNTNSVILAVNNMAVEYSFKYGIIFASTFVILTVLAIICTIAGSSKKKK